MSQATVHSAISVKNPERRSKRNTANPVVTYEEPSGDEQDFHSSASNEDAEDVTGDEIYEESADDAMEHSPVGELEDDDEAADEDDDLNDVSYEEHRSSAKVDSRTVKLKYSMRSNHLRNPNGDVSEVHIQTSRPFALVV